jgi:hypothetical protein
MGALADELDWSRPICEWDVGSRDQVLYPAIVPIEIGIWRIDSGVARVSSSALADERRLEDVIEQDLSILGLDLLLILGRQVETVYGKKIDLLAIDADGVLYVIELKKDRTPREIVAQLLDYGSWVGTLTVDDISAIYAKRAHGNGQSFTEAFQDRFGAELPETLNESHQLIIVASELDASTERIVEYLSAYGVPINALFFRYFKDGSAEYIARSWLLDPVEAEVRRKRTGTKRTQAVWNGRDFYVSFGEDEQRSWEDARRYGFISGGGGKWYSGTLSLLEPGHRVFVNIPQTGYVGVGMVTESVQPVNEFMVEVDGVRKPILEAPVKAPNMGRELSDPGRREYLVRVDWLKTVPRDEAYWETGFFANQNTVCRLRQQFTLDKLCRHFGVADGTEDAGTVVARAVVSGADIPD